jgi:two-component system cell cycle sensor histidine kinase/response regulator CckA
MLKNAILSMLDKSHRYRWLPLLIVLLIVVTLGIGTVLLRYVERYLVTASGEALTLAAAEVSDKVDRLLFERFGDAQVMARVFALPPFDRAYQTKYLAWMKAAYTPVYMWLGVTDQRGIMVAATDESLLGQDYGKSRWFQVARERRTVVADDVDIHEADNGVETIAYTAPILDAHGAFLGVVTTRIGVHMVEEVTTRTIRSLERRAEFGGSVEYQMVTREGKVFADSIEGMWAYYFQRYAEAAQTMSQQDTLLGQIGRAHV